LASVSALALPAIVAAEPVDPSVRGDRRDKVLGERSRLILLRSYGGLMPIVTPDRNV